MRLSRRRFMAVGLLPLSLGLFGHAAAAPSLPRAERRTWVLRAYGERGNLTRVLPGSEVTLVVDSASGRLTGSAGCNSYSAAFGERRGRLTVGPPVSTKKFCGEPEGVMRQETRYLELLRAVESYRIRGQRLVLFTAQGQVLRFRAR